MWGSDSRWDSNYLRYQTPPTFVAHGMTSGMACDKSCKEGWEWSLGMRLVLSAMLKGEMMREVLTECHVIYYPQLVLW